MKLDQHCRYHSFIYKTLNHLHHPHQVLNSQSDLIIFRAAVPSYPFNWEQTHPPWGLADMVPRVHQFSVSRLHHKYHLDAGQDCVVLASTSGTPFYISTAGLWVLICLTASSLNDWFQVKLRLWDPVWDSMPAVMAAWLCVQKRRRTNSTGAAGIYHQKLWDLPGQNNSFSGITAADVHAVVEVKQGGSDSLFITAMYCNWLDIWKSIVGGEVKLENVVRSQTKLSVI